MVAGTTFSLSGKVAAAVQQLLCKCGEVSTGELIPCATDLCAHVEDFCLKFIPICAC